MRLVNDFEFRLIVTLGYLAWNSLFSWVISAFCPPRTSWSQTVNVTGPAAETFVLIADVGFSVGFFVLEPGVHPAASTTMPTAATLIRSTLTRPFISVLPYLISALTQKWAQCRAIGRATAWTWLPAVWNETSAVPFADSA